MENCIKLQAWVFRSEHWNNWLKIARLRSSFINLSNSYKMACHALGCCRLMWMTVSNSIYDSREQDYSLNQEFFFSWRMCQTYTYGLPELVYFNLDINAGILWRIIIISVSVWSMDVIKLRISGDRFHFSCCCRQRRWEPATCSVVSMVHWSARQTRFMHVLSPRWHSLIHSWNTQPAWSVITWTQRRLEKRLDPASDRCSRNLIYSYFKRGIL
jgi:hypothetical protein